MENNHHKVEPLVLAKENLAWAIAEWENLANKNSDWATLAQKNLDWATFLMDNVEQNPNTFTTSVAC